MLQAEFITVLIRTGKMIFFFRLIAKSSGSTTNLQIQTLFISGQRQDEKITPEHKETEEENDNEFAYEKDLQNFLAKNLSLIEPGLSLYVEEEITGIEFPVGNRFIDILAIDSYNNYVVMELKVSRGYDSVVGRLDCVSNEHNLTVCCAMK